MPRLFGTDGVRGVANKDLTPDLALALGRAAGLVLAPSGGSIVVGRDTRVSGPMLESALVAGLCSAGVDARSAGVVPTPAVAFLTVDEGARAGGMVSASHNPVPDNGIKFFSDEGMKVPEGIEVEIERLVADPPTGLPDGEDVGTAEDYTTGVDRYVEHLVRSVHTPLTGLRIVLDCAFGSAWRVAPWAAKQTGADVIAMNDEPDGTRINVDCGSTSLDGIARRVVEEGADLGLAFDGDADRVLAVDEHGEVVDGDRIIALSAIALHETGELKNDVVVATVMANLGFRRALEARGIEVVQAPVGDKYVVEAMMERGAVLGGEQSGHIIFGQHATTGDGVLAGLKVAEAVARSGEPLSRLAHVFEPVPQVLINVRVGNRDGLESAGALWDEVRRIESEMGDDGRVLLRPSGTEPLIRVMVEAVDARVANRNAEALAAMVDRHLA
jgi:phosphoglucosamine mutase